jgi:DNA-binding transcriptional LysR family regulator
MQRAEPDDKLWYASHHPDWLMAPPAGTWPAARYPRNKALASAYASERDSGHSLTRQLIRVGLGGADITLIDSLTAQRRLAQAGFGLALVPESSVREELRQGALVTLDIPSMRTTVPITAIYRRNGYVSSAAKALLKFLTEGVDSAENPAPRRLPESSG